MRESKGSMRGVVWRGPGRIDIRSLRLGAQDLLADARYLGPPGDRTQLRVALPRAVAPGEVISLHIEFRNVLPPVFARSGYQEDFLAATQWFPKLARLRPEGYWASYPYHALGEFDADFADYELSLRVPSDWHVAASAEAKTQGSIENMPGGVSTLRFSTPRALDLAFFAWRRGGPTRLDREGVALVLHTPRGYGAMGAAYRPLARGSLDFFSKHYGAYPYPSLQLALPPAGAEGAAAMEYPGLVALSTQRWPLPGFLLYGRYVLVHEIAHQWFYALVASDEVSSPVLDEGLSEWIALDFLNHFSLEEGARRPQAPFDLFTLTQRFAFSGGSPVRPSHWPAYAYRSTRDYARAVYAKPALLLETIARTWGRERLRRALGNYARAHRFQHATLEELYASFDREYGEGFAGRFLRPALEEGAHAETRLFLRTSSSAGQGDALHLERRGSLPLPLEVDCVDAAGARRRLTWPASRSVLSIPLRGMRAVVVDPEGRNLLDPERGDDRWFATEAQRGKTTFVALLRSILQSLLSLWLL